MPRALGRLITAASLVSHGFCNAFVVGGCGRGGGEASTVARRFLSVRPPSEDPHVETILFVECGFGSDAHGQNATKAAVRACRNAIEFNQIPSIGTIVPGGREAMKLDVLLAVPALYQAGLDLNAVRQCFPYGRIRVQIQDGGMIARNGKVIAEMGDVNEDMIVVCAAITVGY